MARPGFKPPGAGALRHRIALQDRLTSPGSGAALDQTFTTIATVAAQVRALQGGRYVAGASGEVQTEEVVTHVFLIRWRGDQAKWRWILFNGRRFVVRTYRNIDEMNIWGEIQAEEMTKA